MMNVHRHTVASARKVMNEGTAEEVRSELVKFHQHQFPALKRRQHAGNPALKTNNNSDPDEDGLGGEPTLNKVRLLAASLLAGTNAIELWATPASVPACFDPSGLI